MPITKFSWAGFKENLRKFGAIYVAGILVTLLCTNLIWTMTRPRVPDDQSVTIYLADGYSNPDALDGIAAQMLEAGKTFDETLEEVVFYSMSYSNPEEDYTSSVLMATRLSTGEADAFLCNEYAFENLTGADAVLNLEPYLESGWLEGLDVETVEVEIYDYDNTGEVRQLKDKYIGAIKLDNVNALRSLGAMENEGAYLVIACNGTNIDTTMYAVDTLMRLLMEA